MSILFPPQAEDDMEEHDLQMIYDPKRLSLEPMDDGSFPVNPNIPFARPHWFLQALIGGGHYSNVYSCWDTRGGGSGVAMKIMHSRQECFEAGYGEVRVLKRIQAREGEGREHLLQMLDYFYHREHLVIVTELLRGSLSELNEDLKVCACVCVPPQPPIYMYATPSIPRPPTFSRRL